jgi:hypothetical protein
MRFVHFFMGLPFYLNPYIPASAVVIDNNKYHRDSLVHFHGTNESPFIFHQLKLMNPTAFQHVVRLKPSIRDTPSFCCVPTHLSDTALYEEMTLANSHYDANAAVSMAKTLYDKTDNYFATIK